MGDTAANMGFIVWMIGALAVMMISWMAVVRPAISLIAAYRAGDEKRVWRRAAVIALSAIAIATAVIILLAG